MEKTPATCPLRFMQHILRGMMAKGLDTSDEDADDAADEAAASAAKAVDAPTRVPGSSTFASLPAEEVEELRVQRA